ncbi:sigma-54-dependent Fis family transcriptional regulator [Sporosarcina sp. P1]|uniref:sigma-54 interaction domain-containing protein n=1 Tax=Sporosarcina sp. P1 TaxID=2048257 RepID=UPI000C16FB0D|nr:sigma 54-interacting transcriptional regulator [Sporosarcina sp. P1]PIC83001.1 transcriptional regulator [Sporosarcina sp. P1]
MDYQTLYDIFQNSYDGILLLDNSGYAVTANESYTRITGTPLHDVIGKNYREVTSLHDMVTPKVLEQKRPATIINFVRGKGILVTGNPVFNETGKITHVVINVRDISMLKSVNIEMLLSIALKELHSPAKPEEEASIPVKASGLISKSACFNKVVQMASKIAKVDTTVLLLGESGAGKEVIANLIHTQSNRADNPLIKVNCAAIPHNLLESELFGYEKGAFTGADKKGRPGLFEQADKGTIFLDEIGDIHLDMQVKLLRVLQEREITRIGGTSSIPVDVRVITATNKDLEDMTEKGEFRKDLFYRLNVVPIAIPSLKDRQADIAPLAFDFLNRFNEKYQQNKKLHLITVQVMEQYEWPGNIRELENLMERLVVTLDHDEIIWDDLPFVLKEPPKPENIPLKQLLQDVEKKVIYQKLDEYKTTRKTAEALGISQSALVKKLQKFKEDS